MLRVLLLRCGLETVVLFESQFIFLYLLVCERYKGVIVFVCYIQYFVEDLVFGKYWLLKYLGNIEGYGKLVVIAILYCIEWLILKLQGLVSYVSESSRLVGV